MPCCASVHRVHPSSVLTISTHGVHPSSALTISTHWLHPPSVLTISTHQVHPSSVLTISIHWLHPPSVLTISTYQKVMLWPEIREYIYMFVHLIFIVKNTLKISMSRINIYWLIIQKKDDIWEEIFFLAFSPLILEFRIRCTFTYIIQKLLLF